MRQYHKIDTVFKRDPATKHKTLLLGEYSRPEFQYLADCEWLFTEKVDGTNIRIMWDGSTLRFGGKTDNAQIPAFLYDKLSELFKPEHMEEQFPDDSETGKGVEVCLYGEGFGARIQKGGGNYISDGVSFAIFDVKIGDWWLERENVLEIGAAFKLQIAPEIGCGSLPDMVALAEEGFDSAWGPFMAEGIVARPALELRGRNGSRIITKIKHKDFVRS
jgi:hypothetical protein